MKLLSRYPYKLVRTSLAEDERLNTLGAFENDLVWRYSLDKHGFSLVWFLDEGDRMSWILSYSMEIGKNG